MKLNESIQLVNDNALEIIYTLSKFEGSKIDIEAVENIVLNGEINTSVSLNDVDVVRNIARAVYYVMDNSSTFEPNLEYLSILNEFVARDLSLNPGELRTDVLDDSKNKSIPSLFDVDKILEILSSDMTADNIVLVVVGLLGLHPFESGNLATVFLFGNALLMKANIGFINLDPDLLKEYNSGLNSLLLDGDAEDLTRYILESIEHHLDYVIK